MIAPLGGDEMAYDDPKLPRSVLRGEHLFDGETRSLTSAIPKRGSFCKGRAAAETCACRVTGHGLFNVVHHHDLACDDVVVAVRPALTEGAGDTLMAELNVAFTEAKRELGL